MKKTIGVRLTDEAAKALEELVAHYRKEFASIKESDIVNKAIVELAAKLKQ